MLQSFSGSVTAADQVVGAQKGKLKGRRVSCDTKQQPAVVSVASSAGDTPPKKRKTPMISAFFADSRARCVTSSETFVRAIHYLARAVRGPKTAYHDNDIPLILTLQRID
jgi:hypothetical protein